MYHGKPHIGKSVVLQRFSSQRGVGNRPPWADPRDHGVSSGADIPVILKAFVELARLWWTLRRISGDQVGIVGRNGERGADRLLTGS